jgi:ferredoxin
MPEIPRVANRVDVLRWPVIGSVLRWRHVRTSAQLVLLIAAAVVILHGLFGPQVSPTNLATVLTWVHYRGLLIGALLAVGNVFCMGCPFVLVRDAGRRLHAPVLRWPRRLRTKWIALALFVLVLFAYELFDLWALPRATAFLVLGYFVAALAVDVVFRGATFCKYLCPIGQFNFVASTLSPLQLEIRDEDTCRACETSDCIKGRRRPDRPAAIVQRGCELALFLPLKVGNMDCTFCMDCVHACPHDNIALAARVPGAELVDGRRRSGVGRFARRADIVVLAILFVFGALLNAFGMTAPVYAVERWLSAAMGVSSEAPVLAVLFIAGLGVIPVLTLGGSAALTRLLADGPAGSTTRIAMTYAYALVPIGFGVWVAHYGFHLLTGALTIVPVVQSAAIDMFGWAALGSPRWRMAGMRPGSVFPLQVGSIVLGTFGSVAVAYLISERDYPDRPGPPTVPWAIVALALGAAALWILSQPMEMRGIGFPG